jgi:hypothetical protein
MPVTTYVWEYPHPRVNVQAHLDGIERRLTLDDVRQALQLGVHQVELDLQFRESDQEVVVDHDDPYPESPTLPSVLDTILGYRGGASTVQHDARQFTIVLEPKSPRTYERLFNIMGHYESELSTSADPSTGPRGITFIITGPTTQFYAAYAGRGLNRLAIVEDQDYLTEPQIVNLGPGPFRWIGFQYADFQGRVNDRHFAGFNVRAWDTDDGEQIRMAFAAGVDAVSCRPWDIDLCNTILHSQRPRGHAPSLTVRAEQAILTWRGNSSNDLYMSVGSSGRDGLSFPRQLNITSLLRDQPQGIAPSVTVAPDGRIVDVYQGTDGNRLWFVSGTFISFDRFVEFSGAEHRLTLPDDAGRLGHNPSIAFSPGGQMLVVYEGTDSPNLWYLTGSLNADGSFSGFEQSLTQGTARRGYTPSIAFDPSGRVLVVYQGTDNQRLFYVSGSLDGLGRIAGSEFRLTTDDERRRGYTPSIAINNSGFVVIAYQGTSDEKIWFSYGSLLPNGSIAVQNESLLVDNRGVTVHGYHPTVAFDSAGRLTILYEGTSDGKLWYVSGLLNTFTGAIDGPERLLDMDFGDERAQLFVNRVGNGTVTSNPAGISCGSVCSSSFRAGSSVQLFAAPSSAWVFSSWSGACTGAGTCTVGLEGNRTVTANFAPCTPIQCTGCGWQPDGCGGSQWCGDCCYPLCGSEGSCHPCTCEDYGTCTCADFGLCGSPGSCRPCTCEDYGTCTCADFGLCGGPYPSGCYSCSDPCGPTCCPGSCFQGVCWQWC